VHNYTTLERYQHVCRVCIYNYKTEICAICSNLKKIYNFSTQCPHNT